jgi:hypothetical protein
MYVVRLILFPTLAMFMYCSASISGLIVACCNAVVRVDSLLVCMHVHDLRVLHIQQSKMVGTQAGMLDV